MAMCSSTVLCYYDEPCLATNHTDPLVGVGCIYDVGGQAGCRFCGAGDFLPCPAKPSSALPLLSSGAAAAALVAQGPADSWTFDWDDGLALITGLLVSACALIALLLWHRKRVDDHKRAQSFLGDAQASTLSGGGDPLSMGGVDQPLALGGVFPPQALMPPSTSESPGSDGGDASIHAVEVPQSREKQASRAGWMAHLHPSLNTRAQTQPMVEQSSAGACAGATSGIRRQSAIARARAAHGDSGRKLNTSQNLMALTEETEDGSDDDESAKASGEAADDVAGMPSGPRRGRKASRVHVEPGTAAVSDNAGLPHSREKQASRAGWMAHLHPSLNTRAQTQPMAERADGSRLIEMQATRSDAVGEPSVAAPRPARTRKESVASLNTVGLVTKVLSADWLNGTRSDAVGEASVAAPRSARLRKESVGSLNNVRPVTKVLSADWLKGFVSKGKTVRRLHDDKPDETDDQGPGKEAPRQHADGNSVTHSGMMQTTQI